MQGQEWVQGLQLQRQAAEEPVEEPGELWQEGSLRPRERWPRAQGWQEEQPEQRPGPLRLRWLLLWERHTQLWLGGQELEPRSWGQSEEDMGLI